MNRIISPYTIIIRLYFLLYKKKGEGTFPVIKKDFCAQIFYEKTTDDIFGDCF